MKHKLLIVDDDDSISTQMKWALTADYDVTLAEDRASALEAFRTVRPMAVLLDLGLPPSPASPEEGFNTLSDLLAVDRLTKVVIITGQSEKENALRAIGNGAYDLLCKPVDMDELRLLLKRCFYVAELEREYHQMQSAVGSDGFEGMLGTSPVMQDVFGSIKKVATTDVPVLILGESGTGKEMIARAIHQRSGRKNEPFVAINCGAIPENLLESELFGHERGAFTGAHVQRKGRVETADKGTLFLDEVGELPMPLQVKLLRFVQEQTIERIGGRSPIQVNTRVVAATNVDLKKAMLEGKFREDLFYRLAVVSVKLPALRERSSDIPLLAKAFLRRFAKQQNRSSLDFSAKSVRAIQCHNWPGNVRELENRIKRAVIMAEGRYVTPSDLELQDDTTNTRVTLKQAREAAEREVVLSAMQRAGGKISRAAEDLEISRPTLYELLEKLGIMRDAADDKEA
ncbi:MAG TPA: PEP-CTERM-box response regulator transcription factor [Candidatus Paceibacterota bacterium]|nr:PEP-CTERM-box response regulator transcription factor [Candidatus Paceibacterota bacterium]